MDGLVTTFAVVTGAAGASLAPGVILIVGFANVFADAFSMGASSYLSAVSEESTHEHMHRKRPGAKGVVTFISFVLIGMVPLAPFLYAFIVPSFAARALTVSIVVTLVSFAGVGYISGLALGKNPFKTALRNTSIGALAAAIAFGVGHTLATVFGV